MKSVSIRYAWLVLAVVVGSSTFSTRAQAQTAPSTYTAYSGTDTKPIPPAPALGPANSAITDPTFGSRILRVTDENTNAGESFISIDAGIFRAWNADSTAIKLTGPHGDGYWLEFNPSSFNVGDGSSRPAIHRVPFGARWEWSAIDPNLIYFLNGNQIGSYNKSTGLTRNLGGPGNGDPVTYFPVVIGQDDWVCAAAGPGVQDSYTEIFCTSPRSAETKFIDVLNRTINGVPQPDPWPTSATGKTIGIHGVSGGTGPSWLEVTFHNHNWGANGSSVFNISTNTWSMLTNGDPYWSGHVSIGNGRYSNAGGSINGRDSRGMILRNPDALMNSSSYRFIEQPPDTLNQWCDSEHSSWQNSSTNPNAPILVSRFTVVPPCQFAWSGEIIGAAVDGSNTVWRFAHNHSGGNCYFGQGFAQISNDGRWALFSSVWDGMLGPDTSFGCTTRIDTFIVQLYEAVSSVPVTVQTSPPGLSINVDGTTYTAPQNFSWLSGSAHTIGTSTPQGSGGTRFAFANWSDGGAISHTVAPSVPTTYTAYSTTQYSLITSVSSGGSGTISVSPSSGNGYYDSGTSVQISASPDSGFAFSNWSGDLTGSTNPQSLMMSAPKSVIASFNVTSSSSSSSGGLRFVPVAPCRLVDTRNPSGPFGGPAFSAETIRSFTIPAGSCGIPSNALAYSLNVTVIPMGPLGYVTIWPTGQTRPLVSTLNSRDGRTKANAAVVVAGINGAINVYVTDPSHVILDINGYFALPSDAPSGLMFYSVTPCRVIDTRLADGPLGGPVLSGGTSRTVPIRSSSCGLPPTAVAYSLNVTAYPNSPLDSVTAWPTGSPQPTSPTLYNPTGTIVANAAIVRSGTDGSIDLFATQQTHLFIDINGYFAPPATGGLLFYPLAPCRVVDTRLSGPLGGPAISGQRDFNISAGGCPVPSTARAYALNATVLPHGFLGYLTMWAAGQPQPLVSTLNAREGVLVNNGAIVPTSNGAISAYTSNEADLILDLNGVFAP